METDGTRRANVIASLRSKLEDALAEFDGLLASDSEGWPELVTPSCYIQSAVDALKPRSEIDREWSAVEEAAMNAI